MADADRLELRAYGGREILSLLEGRAALSRRLGVEVPDEWPQFPEAFSPPKDAARPPGRWPGFFFLSPKMRALVGSGGFKGGPDSAGIVEIGYEIAPRYWNLGYATAAVRAMLAHAFADAAVTAVIAHTLGEENASGRVLRKTGFQFVEAIEDPDDGPVWRWIHARDGREPSSR